VFCFSQKFLFFFRVGGPIGHKVSGGRAQRSQAACDVLRIAIELKLGYCGTCNRKDKMAKKELKPEYQPGGAKRHVIIDKAVKYLVEFPGLQSDKKFFLLDEIGLSTTEYLEALNRASNGELVKTALGD
jgi:hypothetical protein